MQPLIEADEARWVTDPLFLPRDGGDAAPLFFSHVRWEGADGGAPVSTELSAKLRFDGGWPQNVDQLDVSNVDTAWPAQLGEYGFLDIESTGPLEAAAWTPTYEPVPNFIDLQTFAKCT